MALSYTLSATAYPAHEAPHRLGSSVSFTSGVSDPPLVKMTVNGISEVTWNENLILARLSPSERWRFIAKRHTGFFVFSIISIIVASFVFVSEIWVLIPSIVHTVVGYAYAQASSPETIAKSPLDYVNPRNFVSLLMTISLFWSYSIFSKTDNEKKIGISWESIRFLFGFFSGLLTGKV